MALTRSQARGRSSSRDLRKKKSSGCTDKKKSSALAPTFNALHEELGEAWSFMSSPDVLSGYRVRLTWGQTLISLFKWHNETMNVWTHIVGAAIFLWVFWGMSTSFDQEDLAPTDIRLERWPIFVFLTCAVLCMVFSSAFHLLYCHSLSMFKAMVRIDYSGIALLIGGSYFPWLYYNFYCLGSWQQVYLTSVVLIGSATFFLSLLEFFSRPQFNTIRIFTFIGFGAFCVVPTAHMLFLHSLSSEAVSSFLWVQLLEVGLYLGGAMILLFRIPERWYPGLFDWVGSSHQLWHIFVILGAVSHYKMCLDQFEYRQQHMCGIDGEAATGFNSSSGMQA
jgi:channel protein (hemolysin III family)